VTACCARVTGWGSSRPLEGVRPWKYLKKGNNRKMEKN
jgi:hypothetical protein